MTGDCHVRFCESRGVRLPPATRHCPPTVTGPGPVERKTVTDTIDVVDSMTMMEPDGDSAPARGLSTEELAAELLARADGDPVRLVGPGGLLAWSDQTGARGRAGGGDDRARRLRAL